jgi:hypothetical protein
MKRTLLAAMILLLPVSSILAQRDIKTETIQGHTMYIVLKKGDIPGVYNPEYYGADKAADVYFDEEPLMLVSGETTIHAYSTWHLDRHEIVNDHIEGKALAVTW